MLHAAMLVQDGPKAPKADGRFEGKQNNITKQMNTTNWKTGQRVGGVGDKLCAKAVPVLEEIYQSLAAALSFWWVRLHFTAMVGSFSFFFFLLDFLSANPQRQISISMCI
jgi:hypothetical protein